MGLKQFQVEICGVWKKNRSFAPGPRGYLIKNCFGTIEGLPIGLNCTVGIFASQDSYGLTAIILIKNQKLRSWSKKLSNQKFFFSTIEGLPIGFNCTERIFLSQDSYGFTAIYLIFEQEKKVQFFPEQGGCLLRKLLQYDSSLTYILSYDLLKHLGSKLLWVQNDLKFIFWPFLGRS